ncbi:MAG: hypothetical protein A3C79_02680 [Candidatus Taylorbacteria bacterium RIFCSPHIGHO2_02_FULL_45_28]|nr:MAG: hypothetical protein A2830_03485 [Candidatus Taylorbacteria bacterium RIFCSPHIGHO2_01_FULL_44_110]OHA25355.1 MAG: hypothetical protein A3C79_02680 [Candidatus Taylorbacteria bacterium RIFCSPHIGHO2_02_FULL_45_28]OHA33015.1 MAG: hypothetical protein A3A23_01325 [Candidatus Taylorbacteria bacterium RIFCSPLOWO2_01_FULL_45_59]OHA39684.1 MAG: hypothetical protein A3I98_01045 [Candidatus Taylorbacteria bacterium RIFCSPLOWO2_02_FULL_45_10b]
MEMNEQQKIDTILIALQERYTSVHAIRERVQTVSLWILGLLLAASGWLFQAGIYFNCKQKIILTIFSLVIWFVLNRFYFSDLEKGFNSQRRTLAKIEDSLGFYKKSYFSNSEDSLYPQEWKNSGQKNSEGNFFENTYNLLAIGFGIFTLSMLLF